jgi:hypothetical protein
MDKLATLHAGVVIGYYSTLQNFFEKGFGSTARWNQEESRMTLHAKQVHSMYVFDVANVGIRVASSGFVFGWWWWIVK